MKYKIEAISEKSTGATDQASGITAHGSRLGAGALKFFWIFFCSGECQIYKIIIHA